MALSDSSDRADRADRADDAIASDPTHAWAAPAQSSTGRKFGSLVDRMNRWLVPYIGPPPLGPYNEAPRPAASASACPLCGSPMAAHTINRDAPRTQLHCPA